MLASAVARLLAAEIAFLSTVDPCVRIADFVVCTQKGLVLVLLVVGDVGGFFVVLFDVVLSSVSPSHS